jgi:hypothetical protein
LKGEVVESSASDIFHVVQEVLFLEFCFCCKQFGAFSLRLFCSGLRVEGQFRRVCVWWGCECIGRMRGLACNACNVEFAEESAQKEHYRSEWHRYNLRRKVWMCSSMV